MEFHWTPKENLHVTLNFLGETDVERLVDLEQLLEAATQTLAPCKTSLRGMGAFPDEHHMRVLWVGVRKSRALASLQNELGHRLEEAGFPNEDREYLPHLTIGRLRKSRTAVDLISPFVRTSFDDLHVRSVILYESVLQKAYPVYKKLSSNCVEFMTNPDRFLPEFAIGTTVQGHEEVHRLPFHEASRTRRKCWPRGTCAIDKREIRKGRGRSYFRSLKDTP